jgi:hypothetical protein
MRQRLLAHIWVVASIILLHPDDLLNRIRMLNLDTMQLEDSQGADVVRSPTESGFRVQGLGCRVRCGDQQGLRYRVRRWQGSGHRVQGKVW